LTGDWDRQFEQGSRRQRMIDNVIPAWDRYVGLTDVQAITRLTALFARPTTGGVEGQSHHVAVEPPPRTVVLVGGFNNEWTLSLTANSGFTSASPTNST
jgi:hypothetical protein